MRDDARPAPGDDAPRTLRPTMATVTMVVILVVAVVVLGDAALRAGFGEMMLVAPWVLLVVWVVYVMQYASCIRFDRGGVTVQNYLRRTRIPWGQVADIALRYQVVFSLVGGGVVTAFGGPATGRAAARARDRDRSSLPSSLRDVERLRDAWQDAASEGVREGHISRSWDVPALIALAVIAVWAVLAVIIMRG